MIAQIRSTSHMHDFTFQALLSGYAIACGCVKEMTEKFRKTVELFYALLIYLAVLVSVVLAFPSAKVTKARSFPPLFREFMKAKELSKNRAVQELEALRTYVKDEPAVTFIMDKPFGSNIEDDRFFHDIRNVMVPTLLNPEKGERVAIIYCSTREIAEQRLEAVGYKWAIPLAGGRGIAVPK